MPNEKEALRSRWQFFFENAGYATPPGRAQCALDLARAELLAETLGLDAMWEDEYDPDDSWMDEQARKDLEDGTIIGPFYVSLGRMAGVGGVYVLAPTWLGDDPYVRVLNAELAAEALAQPESHLGRPQTCW